MAESETIFYNKLTSEEIICIITCENFSSTKEAVKKYPYEWISCPHTSCDLKLKYNRAKEEDRVLGKCAKK